MTSIMITAGMLTFGLMSAPDVADQTTEVATAAPDIGDQTTEIASAAPAIPIQQTSPQYQGNDFSGYYYNQPQPVTQQNGAQRREAIRSMHILDRPSRIGHFYGNTVRRRASRGR